MLNTEQARKTATVGNAHVNGHHDPRRKGRNRRRPRFQQSIDPRHEQLAVWGLAHAAVSSLGRKLTMTDFEVGVSLISPKLFSGTNTFSSG